MVQYMALYTGAGQRAVPPIIPAAVAPLKGDIMLHYYLKLIYNV